MTESQIRLLKLALLTTTGAAAVQTLRLYGLKRRYRHGKKVFLALQENAMYLLHILEENNVDLTEFDLLALNAAHD